MGQNSTLAKSLDVLDLVVGSPYPPSAAQITEKLGLPRPTTNRIISNLVKFNYLKRNAGFRPLAEGDRLLRLAIHVITNATQQGPAHEILRELADQFRETCNVGMIVSGRVQYIDRVETNWPLALRLEPGNHVPLHCTAMGKLLLACMPAVQREKHLKTLTLEPRTPNTITDRSILRKHLAVIAQQNYSFDDQEHLQGVYGIAVPIPSDSSSPIMALGMAAPTARASSEDMVRRVSVMQEYAARLGTCYSMAQ